MNKFARLQYLQRMCAEIQTATTKLDISTPNKGSFADQSLVRQIADWRNTIELMLKDVKSQSHFNHMIHRQSRGTAAAYSAGQSLRDKEKNLGEIRRALFGVAIALAELIKRYYAGPSAEKRALEGMKHGLNRIMKSGGDDGDLLVGPSAHQYETTIRALQNDLPDVPGSTFTPGSLVDVFTLILAFFVLLKSMSSDDSSDT